MIIILLVVVVITWVSLMRKSSTSSLCRIRNLSWEAGQGRTRYRSVFNRRETPLLSIHWPTRARAGYQSPSKQYWCCLCGLCAETLSTAISLPLYRGNLCKCTPLYFSSTNLCTRNVLVLFCGFVASKNLMDEWNHLTCDHLQQSHKGFSTMWSFQFIDVADVFVLGVPRVLSWQDGIHLFNSNCTQTHRRSFEDLNEK